MGEVSSAIDAILAGVSPDLDTGQARVNGYHHPERYLLPEDDQGP